MKDHGKKIGKKVILYLIALLFLFIFIYPLYFVIISSLKTNTEIFTTPFAFPKELQLLNYKTAIEIGNIGRQFLNSLFLAIVTLALTILMASMVSYAISRLRFKGQGAIRVYFVMGMMVPIQSIIVPLAWAINNFNIRDNYLILILLFTASHMPLATFIITGSMNSLPTSLEEAAIIDGCSIYKVYSKIVLPLVKPAMATVGIFVFMYTWNDLLVSMVFIGKAELRTISVGLLNFVGARKSDYGALMAAIFIAILPPLLMYLFLQENVVKGLTSGANK
ncbi:MAG TPA: carbohydrate ABC transporter permease [Candidatus Pelethocola excrementipullorum]|nr:carbohydrate ABC transporter permease [Candidatus Pelethocola excrementipullorum]